MTLEFVLKTTLNVFELTAACTGFILWKKWKHTHWKWFSIFLAFIFITEILAKIFYNTNGLKQFNPFVYRYINIPVFILFYLWILSIPIKIKAKNILQVIFISGYILLFLCEEFIFKKFFRNFGSISYQFGALGILCMSLIYYINIINTNDILTYKFNIHFWVSVGLIIYMITTLPFNAMRNTLFKEHYSIAMAYWYFTFLFNYMMYSFFIIGFIWGKAK